MSVNARTTASHFPRRALTNFPPKQESISTKLVELAGRRIATGKDFDPATGRLKSETVRLLDADAAKAVAAALRRAEFTVADVAEKPFRR